MLISLRLIYKTSVIETLKNFAGLQGEKRRIPVLMSRSRLRESTKLSPRGFQTSCPTNLNARSAEIWAKKNATRFGVAVHKPKALRSEAESMLIRSLLRHSFSNQLGRGQKKTPPQ